MGQIPAIRLYEKLGYLSANIPFPDENLPLRSIISPLTKLMGFGLTVCYKKLH